jgi:hypothetical protein
VDRCGTRPHATIDFDVALSHPAALAFQPLQVAIRCLGVATHGILIAASDYGHYAVFVCNGETRLLA